MWRVSSVPSILFAFVCIPFCLLNTKHFCDLLASLFIGSFTDSFADIAVCHLYSLLEEMVATMKENDCSIAEMRSLSGSCGGNRGSFDSSLQSFLFFASCCCKGRRIGGSTWAPPWEVWLVEIAQILAITQTDARVWGKERWETEAWHSVASSVSGHYHCETQLPFGHQAQSILLEAFIEHLSNQVAKLEATCWQSITAQANIGPLMSFVLRIPLHFFSAWSAYMPCLGSRTKETL